MFAIVAFTAAGPIIEKYFVAGHILFLRTENSQDSRFLLVNHILITLFDIMIHASPRFFRVAAIGS